MEGTQILKADILDILFENRNKKYGAYLLRKTYRKRLWVAVLITIFAAFLAVWFLQPAAAETNTKIVEVRSVVLENIEELKPTPPPPPPPVKEELPPPRKEKMVAPAKPQIVKTEIKRTKFTPPVIKEDKDVKQNEMPPVKEIATVDVVTTTGVAREELAANMPVVSAVNGVDKGTGVIDLPKKKEDENKIFEKVEIEASVNMAQWRRHLESRLLRYIEDAAAQGMAPGQYTVNVRFVVEKDGRISQASALNNPGYGLSKGAVQVVKTGPQWTPGEQNGRKVRSYHTQPVTFVIMDS